MRNPLAGLDAALQPRRGDGLFDAHAVDHVDRVDGQLREFGGKDQWTGQPRPHNGQREQDAEDTEQAVRRDERAAEAEPSSTPLPPPSPKTMPIAAGESANSWVRYRT